jgi:malonate decarboxylase delta subunit
MEQRTEILEYEFAGRGETARTQAPPVLVGVVSSGNLEVLLESSPLKGGCKVVVNTSTQGFGDIWEAVIQDFFNRHSLCDVQVSINDMGATPAVVSLRLDQALEEFQREAA